MLIVENTTTIIVFVFLLACFFSGYAFGGWINKALDDWRDYASRNRGRANHGRR